MTDDFDQRAADLAQRIEQRIAIGKDVLGRVDPAPRHRSMKAIINRGLRREPDD